MNRPAKRDEKNKINIVERWQEPARLQNPEVVMEVTDQVVTSYADEEVKLDKM